MGLQEYTLRLVPRREQMVKASKVQTVLTRLGFQSSGPSGLGDEILYKKNAERYVLEALLKIDGAKFCHLSFRFAICQPEVAAERFHAAVSEAARTLDLPITDGVHWFRPGDEGALGEMLLKELSSRKAQWREIFEGDREEPVLHTDEAWGYFLKRHPNVDRTPAPTKRRGTKVH